MYQYQLYQLLYQLYHLLYQLLSVCVTSPTSVTGRGVEFPPLILSLPRVLKLY